MRWGVLGSGAVLLGCWDVGEQNTVIRNQLLIKKLAVCVYYQYYLALL